MRSIIKEKKGDIQSIIYFIVALFGIGVFLLFYSHFSQAFFDKTDQYFESDTNFNDTEAHRALKNIERETTNLWDFVFIGVFVAYIIFLVILAYSTRISPVLSFIYAIISILALFVGVMLSNTWQELAANPEFSDTIARFPITNLILGSYYPMFITAIISIVIIILFGKRGGEGE